MSETLDGPPPNPKIPAELQGETDILKMSDVELEKLRKFSEYLRVMGMNLKTKKKIMKDAAFDPRLRKEIQSSVRQIMWFHSMKQLEKASTLCLKAGKAETDGKFKASLMTVVVQANAARLGAIEATGFKMERGGDGEKEKPNVQVQVNNFPPVANLPSPDTGLKRLDKVVVPELAPTLDA